MLLKAQGEIGEAAPLFREVLAGSCEQLSDKHPSTLVSVNNLAALLKAQGEPGEAGPLIRVALADSREQLGDKHPNTLSLINGLAYRPCKLRFTGC